MRHRLVAPLIAVLLVVSVSAQNGGPASVVYKVSFPAPEHHVASVEVTLA